MYDKERRIIMNKYFHNFLMGVSVLPALAIMPAMSAVVDPITDSPVFVLGDITLANQHVVYNQAAFAGRRMNTGQALSNGVTGYRNDFPNYQMVVRSLDMVDSDTYVGPVTLNVRELTNNDVLSFNYQMSVNGNWQDVVTTNAINPVLVWNVTEEELLASGVENPTAWTMAQFAHLDGNAANAHAAASVSFDNSQAVIDGAKLTANTMDVKNGSTLTVVNGRSGTDTTAVDFLNSIDNNFTDPDDYRTKRWYTEAQYIDTDGKTTLTANTINFDDSRIVIKKDAELIFNVSDKVTFQNSSASIGGAVYNSGIMIISNAKFKDNSAVEGGAIYSRGSETYTNESDLAITRIDNSEFVGNHLTGEDVGAAITVAKNSKLILSNSRFDSNVAENGWAGAIYSYASKTDSVGGLLDISDTVFTNNSALGVGALGVFSEASLKRLTFENNHATDATDDGAGALFFGSVSQSDMLLSNSTFTSNTSASIGGAVATRGTGNTDNVSGGNNEGALLDISSVTFTTNVAGTKGGAFYNAFHGSTRHNGYVTLEDAKFVGNRAVDGGAIYNATSGSLDSVGGKIYGTNLTFTNNIASGNGGAIYNNIDFVLAGTNTFSGNKANNVANDIHNIGTITVASGTTTIDGGVTGDGTLNIADGATLNIGTASVEQGTITLDGNMLATLRDGDAQITAGTFDGNGTLKLSFGGEGTYHVFGNSTFRAAGIDATSSVYDISWANEDKDLVATLKSVEDIAAENGIQEDTAAAIAGASQSTSEKLNDLAVKMQEKLAEETAEAKQEVEKAAAAIHPEKESVTQSIATSVQTAVANLTGARMRMVAPRIGRNGGDARLTSGGVWAQGLFNKSKQNDAFRGYTRGVAAGMDGTINNVWTIGAGYSYAHSEISGTERDTEIDSNTIFVYGQYKPTQWYVNAMLNYTMSDFTEDGVVMGTPVTGDYDVNSFGGVIATGYDFASGVTPELGLRYMHVMVDDYTNSMDVKTKSKDTDFLTGVFGAKYTFGINMDRYTKLIPQLNAAVKYDMLSDRNMATVTMPGVDSYTLRGERLSRIGGEFGIGLGLKYKTVDFSVNYDIDVRKDYTSQTGMLKFRYNF